MSGNTNIKLENYLKKFNFTLKIPEEHIKIAFEKTVTDVRYHYPSIIPEIIVDKIISNGNESAIFLFRLGRIFFNEGDDKGISTIHGLIRSQCSCEIYFSNSIGEGLYLVHSTGSVIGSRNNIGKGFIIYQNCTVGHEFDNENGSDIGNNVTMLPYSSIIGSINVGNNVIIGSYSFLKLDCRDNLVLGGSPAREISDNSQELMSRFRPNK